MPVTDDNGDPVAVAREIALRQLTVRQRTRSELQTAMARRNVPEEAAREVLDRFTEVGLLDDAAFARDWVATGARRMRGRRVLAQELTTKGVAPELIEEALAGTDPQDDREVALEFARRKLRGMAGLDRQVRYRRLAAALERRGFGRGIIVDVVRQVLGEADGDELADD